jgi:excisionase family DNA binding protein
MVTPTPTTAAASPVAVLAAETRVQIPIKEAAALLDISEWLAYKLARSGKLPTRRLGRNLYVPIEALRRFAQDDDPRQAEAEGGDLR